MTEIKRTLRFVRRAAPVIPEHRPLYKIAQLLLILELASRGGKSSLPRLQLFNWALKKPDRRERLLRAKADQRLNVAAWGFDPAVVLALRFAIGQSLIQAMSTNYQITNLGSEFIRTACKEPDNLVTERNFLKALGKSITEAMVSDIAQTWGDA